MFLHSLKLAFRSYMRNKSTFFINLIGLSTGLACVLLIYLWVNNEWSMDKFHEKDSQLYQVMLNLDVIQEILTLENTPLPLANALLEEIPEVEEAVSVNDFFNWPSSEGVLINGDKKITVNGLHASENYFDVFSFPLIQGDKDQVLKDKNGIVISENLAYKLFETTEDIIGKTVEWNHSGYDGSFQIKGVFQDLPTKSTERFDAIFHLQLLSDNDQYADGWNGNYAQTYVVLNKNANLDQLNQKINDLMIRNNEYATNHDLFLKKYSSKYLHNQYENGKLAGGRISYVRLFSLIALFILLIACINFMNLSTARASLRMKEIGIKKTVGASRADLMIRLLSESVLLSFLSLILALFLVSMLLPQFNVITEKQLALTFESSIIASILGITLFTGIVAGAYPAFYLSKFKPSAVLKGKFHLSFGELWIRKGLVVFQFALSVIFIIGVLVINQQIKLAQTKNMGYERDNVITFQWKENLFNIWNGLGEEDKNNGDFYVFQEELKKVAGIVEVTNMHGSILKDIYGQNGITWKVDGVERESNFLSPVVGYDFMKTLGIGLAEGRSFSKTYNDDYHKLIINEAASKIIGFDNSIGQSINVNGQDEIVGVVKDFHYGSLFNSIDPLIFRFEPNGSTFMVKIRTGSERNTIQNIGELYEKFHPSNSFEFNFMDDEYQAIYESETRVAALAKYSSGLAILISCLGLLGLVLFTSERRQKEIGIRKVLGASIANIVGLLSKDFIKLIVIAFVIASPIAWYIMQQWLNNFAYHIEMQWWLFAMAGFATVFVALLTVSFQSIKAALTSPIESLRNE